MPVCIYVDDSFRTHCAPNLCLDDNDERFEKGENCHMDLSTIKNGSCVFVRASLLPIFVDRELPRIANASLSIKMVRVNLTSLLLCEFSCFKMHFSISTYRLFVQVSDRFNDQSVPDSETLPSLRLPHWYVI